MGRRLFLPLLLIAITWRLLEPASLGIVDGRSMEPSLHDGQLFLIDRVSYHVRPVARGDVITFRHGDEMYIKRVVAVGGDTIWLLRNYMTGDSELVADSEVARVRRVTEFHPNMGRLTYFRVPPGTLFVAGDHRSISHDSRSFGPVPVTLVTGRAWW